MVAGTAAQLPTWRWGVVTVIQQVLLELEEDYLGRPYYVSGNALFRAISRRVDAAVGSGESRGIRLW